jgi:hypothetical protein
MAEPTAAGLLRGLRLIRGRDDELLEAVAGRAVRRELPCGMLLFRQDRPYPEIADSAIGELGRRLRRAVGPIEKISLEHVRARVAATRAGRAPVNTQAPGAGRPGSRGRDES